MGGGGPRRPAAPKGERARRGMDSEGGGDVGTALEMVAQGEGAAVVFAEDFADVEA